MADDKVAMKRTGTLTFAKSDPAISLASLFRPVTRGRRPKGLSLSSSWGENLTLHFKIHTCLDSKDQTVFLTLIALAAVKGKDIDKTTETPIGRKLWLDLNEGGDVEYNGVATAFRTSCYEIIKEMGLTHGKASYKTLLDSLDRLDGVSVKGETTASIHSSQKLITYCVDKVSQSIVIGLNSRIYRAINGQYSRIELGERSLLSLDTAKVCHSWLCAWCGTGRSKSIGLDNLISKIWGMQASKESTLRSRRQLVRKAINQINTLPGWNVYEDNRHILRVHRNAISDV